MLFFPLINVKMPTIVGILTFMSRKNFMLSRVEHEKTFINSGPGFQTTINCKTSYTVQVSKKPANAAMHGPHSPVRLGD